MRSDSRMQRREGAIAVQFALLAFGFFAIAAAVIDMRLAMHAQQQMQVAADTAAVEALRQRDAPGAPAVLRDAARTAVEFTFDDDLDPTNGDTLNCGAGPIVRLTGGRPESNALAQVSIAAEKVYDPVLQFNDVNKKHGDIVTGKYVTGTARAIESSDYSRNDFLPAAVADLTTPQESVLVRIRRTSESIRPNPLDREPNVSSAGPTLPFLFGLGTSIHGANIAPGYNPRTEGLTVRATAIASARRAMLVSGPGPGFGYTALQRFGLFSYRLPNFPNPTFVPPTDQFPVPGGGGAHLFKPPAVSPTRPAPPLPTDLFSGRWDDLSVGASVDVVVETTGYLRLVGAGNQPIVGYFAQSWLVPNFAGPPNTPTPLTYVGQVADPRTPVPAVTGETLVPILRPIEGYLVVIGFGRIRVEVVSGGATPTLRITKLAGQVLAVGASAAAPAPLAVVTQINDLKFAHSDFTDAVLAPVLER